MLSLSTNTYPIPEKIRDMIVDDIRASQVRGDKERVLTLLHVRTQRLDQYKRIRAFSKQGVMICSQSRKARRCCRE